MTVTKRREQQKAKRRRWVLPLIGGVGLVGAFVLVVSLWPADLDGAHRAYALAPESALPANFRKASPSVRKAYRFALASPGLLQQIPCYCGCGSDGHKNNADCYIKDVKSDGTVTFDQMSFT